MHEITELLEAWKSGDDQAFNRLIPLVDPELKRAARHYLRDERRDNILQTTALVHDALTKLIKENLKPENRRQFYGFVRRRMREVLVEYARKRQSLGVIDPLDHVDLSEVEDLSTEKSQDVVTIEEALTELAKEHERKVTVIEYRFFVGLSFDEIAAVMGVARRTVQRDWQYAQAWLNRYMTTSGNE